jgi:hypothetical protein
MNTRICALALLAVVAVASTGCGGDDETSADINSSGAPTAVAVDVIGDSPPPGPASDPGPIDVASGDEQAIIDAWVAETQRDGQVDGDPALEAEFRCALERTVPVLGAETAQAYLDQDLQYEGNNDGGLTMEPDDARVLADNFASCLDVDALADVYEAGGLTPDQASCFAIGVHPRFAEIVFTDLTGGDEESVVDYVVLGEECGLL